MATDVRTVPTAGDVTADADWRATAQAVEAALLAVGLTKMAGPTQMDLATVAAPAAVTFAAGYHYFQFTDPRQATRPVYLRVAYGKQGTAAKFGLRFTVAGGWSAAGASQGWVMTEETIGPGTAAVSAAIALRTCFTPAGLWMGLLHPSGMTTHSWGLWVMRSWGGADFGDFVQKHGWTNNTNPIVEVADLAKQLVGGRYTNGASYMGAPGQLDSGIPLAGSDASVWPLMCSIGRVEPIPGAVLFRTTEIGPGTFQADMLGATRNYLQMNNIWPNFSATGTGPCWGLAWE